MRDGSVAEELDLILVLEQVLHAVAKQVGRRDIPGCKEQADHGADLVVVEEVALVLGVDQRGDEVVTGVVAALGDGPAEVVLHLFAGDEGPLLRLLGGEGVEPRGHAVIGPALEVGLVGRVHAKHFGDDDGGVGLAELGHEIERCLVADLVDELVGDLLDAGTHALDSPRRERLGDERAQAGVVGGIEEEHRRFASGVIEAAKPRAKAVLGRLARVHGEVAVVEDGLDILEAADDVPPKLRVVDNAAGLADLVEEGEGILLVGGIEGSQGKPEGQRGSFVFSHGGTPMTGWLQP